MRPAVYKNYVLVILTLFALFNYADRVALGVALEDIKADLQLSDIELGFLSGIAFALFYSIMGIPMARWADRGNRVVIVSLTAVLWSGALVLCGTAGSFLQLLLIRVGVAVGEAGCVPPAFSMIADYFTRAERPRAMSIYIMGGALSFAVGFFLCGWLNELYGWRVMFMLLAAPGLVLAVVAWFTIKEPRGMKPAQKAAYLAQPETGRPPAFQPKLKDVCVTLWANATFRHLLLCYSVLSLFGYGILQWQPAFLARSYGFTSAEAGTWLAVTYGLGALMGAYLGGEWASRYAAGNESLQLKAMTVVIVVCAALATLAYLSRSAYLSLGLIALYMLSMYAASVPLNSTIQTLVPERMRAMSVALANLVANLIGLGFGPLIAGVLSEVLRPWAGQESLRYALLAIAPCFLWAAWHAWRARESVVRDLAAVQIDGVDGAAGRRDAEANVLTTSVASSRSPTEIEVAS